MLDVTPSDWEAVGQDMRLALRQFVDRHGLSRRWLEKELAASDGPLPDPAIIRQLLPWFPGAGKRIIEASSINGENRRLAQRLQRTWYGRWVLRKYWKPETLAELGLTGSFTNFTD